MRTPPEARSDTGGLTGFRIGDAYQLLEPIGGGGTGTVWRARDLVRDVDVAVKLLREDLMAEPKAVNRFVQERAILLMLRHRNIVRVRDLVTVGTSLGLVMDLVDSGSLRDHLVDEGTLPPAEAARLLSQVAGALAEAHRRGVVHRDLKPDNILLELTGQGLETRLTDFGIARVLDTPSMTTPGALVGTANYIAPETVYGGRPTGAVDVYALGVVLYELVAGRPPYSGGPPWATLRRHVDDAPARVEGMPEEIWRLIDACMDKRPGRRPAAKELAGQLRTAAERTRGLAALPPLPAFAEPSTADLPVPQQRTPPSRSFNLMTCVVVVTVFAVLAVLGVPTWRLLFGAGDDARQQARPGASTPSGAQASGNAVPGAVPSSGAPGSRPRSPGTDRMAGQPVPRSNDRSIEVSGYGPWQCGDVYSWDLGHPVLAKPCHSVGGRIRMIAHMQALPGVQADVSLTLTDVRTGAAVAGPYSCEGLMFSDHRPEQSCGPFEVMPPRGQRYVVVQKWVYTGRALLPGGTAKGVEFAW